MRTQDIQLPPWVAGFHPILRVYFCFNKPHPVKILYTSAPILSSARPKSASQPGDIYQIIQHNLYQNFYTEADFFVEIYKLILKYIWKFKEQNS
jgi:hypothetical protein